MRIIKYYTEGWKSLLEHKRMILWLYLSQVLFAFLAAIPLSNVLHSAAGSSLAFSKVELFNFGNIGELLINHRESIDLVLSQAQWLILLYLILSIFLSAGIASVIHYKSSGSLTYSFGSFLSGASKRFFKFLRIGIYAFLSKIIILYLCYKLWLSVSGGLNLFSLESSDLWIKGAMIVIPILVLLISLMSLFFDHLRMHAVQSEMKWIFSAIKQTLQNIMKKPFTSIALYMLNLMTVSFILFIIALLRKSISQESMFTAFLALLLSQLIILIRLGFRVVNFKSIDLFIREQS